MNILNNQFQLKIATAGIVSSVFVYKMAQHYNQKYHLKQYIFNKIWSQLSPIMDYKLRHFKEELFSQAEGNVLDVGSGMGPTFKYLANNNKIKSVIALEPNPFMMDKLLETIQQQPSDFPIRVLNKTIAKAIEDNDIEPQTFDTVICNLVLCSIPNYERIIGEIQDLLKPGGKLLFIEHVISENPVYQSIEHLFNPLWGIFTDGCHLNRVTDGIIKNMDGWERVVVNNAGKQMFKHVYGFAVKDSSSKPQKITIN
ncbi:hypothetical protein DICPUDRAFT_44520 [Dictyostelium purpureum]|uniref:Methyltransferase type 11 domain-containing protein n=1 Tax=Dictyostelium purpureum TaxID=5786 RepID=F0Z6B2_DICPU|nr:uncharacterized protein DICPUDRAFT_44520 [Dictyostelium purpureum]EGC40620.1 hypothetical protein DICPUDRAFT_44520 [Dictyostelium purpureum]|eukprot:XP_003282956.1 hypothetical protein DICPUDRAFT_44520 [Dictyostelium purpureum]